MKACTATTGFGRGEFIKHEILIIERSDQRKQSQQGKSVTKGKPPQGGTQNRKARYQERHSG
ncbi:hypothetical protein SCFA_3770003 [anaerobic digester metagenome]|uniref:Uncharacterized protein n=1 Tax=anaerobic digester metagenome TaxID=1263854 RepID=A0A485M6F6_9ZZZZ